MKIRLSELRALVAEALADHQERVGATYLDVNGDGYGLRRNDDDEWEVYGKTSGRVWFTDADKQRAWAYRVNMMRAREYARSHG